MTSTQQNQRERAATRMSVIVPVYNPGAGFDDLIGSLDRQTLPQDEFEVLLCDDGSDESTRRRLAAAAAERPNMRVLSLEHTGWPGTPRNHGIEAARGTYVYFVDQDDWLFERALERLCDYGDAHATDVVVGKEVGIGRALPGRIFQRDIPRAVLGKDPLLEMLTPHKVFRLSFLRDNGIRFPDGKVRLEDHLFVMQAYFAAKTISILASEPCYAWVKSKGSASAARIDPETYFPHLETVLDLVEANTTPGRTRDTLLRHWYRGKILNRLAPRRMARYPDDYRERFLDTVIPIAQRRFGPGVEAGLPFPLRARSALLRAGRRDADRLFRSTLRESGTGPVRRWLMWSAVRIFGNLPLAVVFLLAVVAGVLAVGLAVAGGDGTAGAWLVGALITTAAALAVLLVLVAWAGIESGIESRPGRRGAERSRWVPGATGSLLGATGIGLVALPLLLPLIVLTFVTELVVGLGEGGPAGVRVQGRGTGTLPATRITYAPPAT